MLLYGILFLIVSVVVAILVATGTIALTLGLGQVLFYGMVIVFMGAILASAFKNRPDEDVLIRRHL